MLVIHRNNPGDIRELQNHQIHILDQDPLLGASDIRFRKKRVLWNNDGGRYRIFSPIYDLRRARAPHAGSSMSSQWAVVLLVAFTRISSSVRALPASIIRKSSREHARTYSMQGEHAWNIGKIFLSWDHDVIVYFAYERSLRIVSFLFFLDNILDRLPSDHLDRSLVHRDEAKRFLKNVRKSRSLNEKRELSFITLHC